MKVTHKQMDSMVRKICQLRGFLCYHTHDSRKSDKGFPDWCILMDDEVLYVELKTGKDGLRAEQFNWVARLRQMGEKAFVVRDEHIGWLVDYISNKFYAEELDLATTMELDRYLQKSRRVR